MDLPTGSAASSCQPTNVIASTPAEQSRKIFVGGLAPSVTDEDFRTYFDRYGSLFKMCFGPKSFMVVTDPVVARQNSFGKRSPKPRVDSCTGKRGAI